MNYSKQRELILQTVASSCAHMTAEEVYTTLRPSCPNLSLGTVYRNLNQLSQHHMLKKIPVSDGSDRFDHRVDEHYHLICEACGKVYDVELPALGELLQTSTANSGFILTRCDLLLRGVCAGCEAEKNKKEKAL